MCTPEGPARPQLHIAVFVCGGLAKRRSWDGPQDGKQKHARVREIFPPCVCELTAADLRAAYAAGADGILIYGCLLRNCLSGDGNLEVLQSIYRNSQTVRQLGLAPLRLRQEWVCEDSSEQLAAVIEDYTKRLAELGPIKRLEGATSVGSNAAEG